MKRIIEFDSAPPGWYARWRMSPEVTRSSQVTVWALVEDSESGTRQVVGVDALGQWQGSLENEPGWDFVRYFYLPVDVGQPDDLFSPAQTEMERVPHPQR